MERKNNMNINPPNGYYFYGGADGIDAFPDAAGYIWFGDDFGKNGDDAFFEFFVCRMKNGITEIIPMPEHINGSARLNWTPAGMYVSGTTKATPNSPVVAKVFQITQYKQFTTGFPVVVTTVNTAVSTVDQYARSSATTAQNTANRAIDTSNDAKNTANNALNVANSKPSIDVVWQKIEDRFYSFYEALRTNNRTDPNNARYMDILYAKVNDWIYAKLKEYKLIP